MDLIAPPCRDFVGDPDSMFAKATMQDSSDPSEIKVKVHFVAVGSAPILKKAKFQISADKRFSMVNSFLRKMLKIPDSAGLLLYCQSAFCPSPDQLVGDLKEAFAVRDELVVHYSLQEAVSLYRQSLEVILTPSFGIAIIDTVGIAIVLKPLSLLTRNTSTSCSTRRSFDSCCGSRSK